MYVCLLYLLCVAPQWFDIEEEKNQNIYVSGLPLDFTLEEFTELMKKCGIIAEDDDGMSLNYAFNLFQLVS